MYLGRNAPPLGDIDPPGLLLPQPPTGSCIELAYFAGATIYDFHDEPCSPIEPPREGGGPGGE